MDVEEKLKLFNRKEEELNILRKKLNTMPNYIGELKLHPLYNIWRAFRFTDKGKKIGNSPEWNQFINFYKDVINNYEENKRMFRKDKSQNWNKNNYIFLSFEEQGKLRQKDHYLFFKGENKTLREWSILLDIPYNIVIQRYYANKKNNKGTNWILSTSPEYNRKWSKNKKNNPLKFKATKLITNYNTKDKKANRGVGDLTVSWLEEKLKNATCIYCNDSDNIGLDRIDNSKPHSKDNVVLCCYSCNVARSNNFTHEEMKILGKTITLIKQNRQNNK